MNSNEVVEILLVEDNTNDADIAISALKRHTLVNTIVHFEDNEELLAYFFGAGNERKTSTKIPIVILLNIKTPKINGIEVLQKLKTEPYTKAIPVVILTPSANKQDITKCYELGANCYISKPIEFDSLAKAIGKLVMHWVLSNKLQ